MKKFERIPYELNVMGGKPCIRGMRITVAMILGLLGNGKNHSDILNAYPYLQNEDIDECLTYAAWRMEERDIPIFFP